MTAVLYGISNCDTVKKARKWLKAHDVTYEFVDFKKSSPAEHKVESWLSAVGKELLLNKRGTTWRKLSDEEQQQPIVTLLTTYSSAIKRPVLEYQGNVYVGFSNENYEQLFGS